MKKIIALLLVIFTVVPFAAACRKNTAEPTESAKPTETASAAESETESEDEAKKTEIMNYVKELSGGLNFAGKTFTYIGKEYDTGSNFPKKEEETGDIESDAVYFRQRDTEELFGIDMEYVRTETGEVTADQVKNEVMAGGTSYDLVHGSTQTTGQTLLNSATIRQVDNLKYVDLDQPWWIASIRDDYSITNRLFFLTGPIVVDNYNDSCCILFNKTVTSMFGIDDTELYNTVKEGKWTIDRMIETASVIPENSTGTGVYRYLEPYGYAFIFSSGMKITSFDDEGNPSVPEALPIEFSNLADKLCPIFSNKAETVFTDYRKSEDPQKTYGVEELQEFFIDNKALFKFAYSAGAMEMRKYDVSFGILPLPKLNESQKNYCTYARMGMDSAVYIPRTVADINMSDAITEALAALSEIYVKEAYYEKLLKGQSIFDLESRDMIDIIFSTKVYDLIALYSGADYNQMGTFLQTLEDGIKLDNSNLASGYKGSARLCNFNAKMLVKAVAKID